MPSQEGLVAGVHNPDFENKFLTKIYSTLVVAFGFRKEGRCGVIRFMSYWYVSYPSLPSFNNTIANYILQLYSVFRVTQQNMFVSTVINERGKCTCLHIK